MIQTHISGKIERHRITKTWTQIEKQLKRHKSRMQRKRNCGDAGFISMQEIQKIKEKQG